MAACWWNAADDRRDYGKARCRTTADRSSAKYVGPKQVSNQGGKSVMTRAEQYRQHAQAAEKQAKRAPDPDAREGLHQIARQWRELAEQTERRELETIGA